VAVKQHESGIAARYANAILELAQELREVESVERDFASLSAMISESAQLSRFIRSPIFSRNDHARGMKAVLSQMNANSLTSRFILTLAAKRRLSLLAGIIRAFGGQLARIRGEVDAEVRSARALTDRETAEIRAAIKSKLGREPRLETRVDPSLLGGLVVKVGSRMIDSSLRTKLNGMRLAMRGMS
jgi:F-type H+-transporting ATPase subunit delta